MRNAFLGGLLAALATAASGESAQNRWTPDIPKTWDEAALATLELPLPGASFAIRHLPADYYYRIPVRKVYRDYPIYRPDREPPGYWEWLQQQEPQVIEFDPSKLVTKADWVRAGESVFDEVTYIAAAGELAGVRSPDWWKATGARTDRDGVFPYGRYVIREKGKVELGTGACRDCHTKVMPDGTVVKGAQGDFPLGYAIAWEVGWALSQAKDRQQFHERWLRGERAEFGAPWLGAADPWERMKGRSLDEMRAAYRAMPPGVVARTRASVEHPTRTPDLFELEAIRFLDASGLVQHRGPGDVMRYAALNMGADYATDFGGFVPALAPGEAPPDPSNLERYSDERLYALALYLYSLEAPPNPNKPGALSARGEKVFRRAGCGDCHTPPLYTNNKLVPAKGYAVAASEAARWPVMTDRTIDTDPGLTLGTRRGTGYYKVPSLKHLWMRSAFGHSGAVATLEDWLDPRRVRRDYVPTGFRPYGQGAGGVPGHEYELRLSADERRALLAFLKTL